MNIYLSLISTYSKEGDSTNWCHSLCTTTFITSAFLVIPAIVRMDFIPIRNGS